MDFVDDSMNSESHGSIEHLHRLSYHRSESINTIDSKEFVCIDDVRIYPASILMENAFEMKQFREKMVIINCGVKMANIRILSPNSSNYRIATLPQGYNLAPGMQIIRYVEHKYKARSSLAQVSFPVFINEKMIQFQVNITVPQSYVVISPKKINFGRTDVGESCKKTVTLRNIGYKTANFYVDIVSNQDFQLCAEPRKGVLEAQSRVTLEIEIKSYIKGMFHKEFWIKTDPINRVRIVGEIIVPELQILHPITASEITVIDFPKLYYGSSNVKTLVIKNESSLPTMFCTVAQIDNNIMALKQARELNDHFKHFDITYEDGRLSPGASTIIKIRFSPYKIYNFKEKFVYGIIKIIKVHCRDISSEDNLLEKYSPNSEKSPAVPNMTDHFMNDEIDFRMMTSESKHNILEIKQFIQVCFHAEIEEPKLKIRPENLALQNANVNTLYTRELYLKNESRHLPIVFRYSKVAFVNVEPKMGILQQNEAIEVLVKLKSSRMGKFETKIEFDLLYPEQPLRDNLVLVGKASIDVKIHAVMSPPKLETKFSMGITPLISNEIGLITEDICYNTQLQLPRQAIINKNYFKFNRDNLDLIAFPNDRPIGLRPWRTDKKCTTIFTNLPRTITPDDEYNLTAAEKEFKDYNSSYYNNFIRRKLPRQTKIIKRVMSDYDITKKHHLMVEGVHCLSTCLEISRNFQHPSFVPLSPGKLNNIIVTPLTVFLGKVSSFNKVFGSFKIENKNDFRIMVMIKPLKSCVTIRTERLIIKEQEIKECNFSFTAGLPEITSVTIALLINSAHIFEVNVLAQVVSPMLECYTDEIIMKPNEKFVILEVFNPVNVPLSFQWYSSAPLSYNVFPHIGVAPPNRTLYSLLSFDPKADMVNIVELVLTVFDESDLNIMVKREIKQAVCNFNKQSVEFGSIPINLLTSKEIILQNMSDHIITFLIDNPNPLEGIQVRPYQGFIKGNSEKRFYIHAKFKNVCDFVTNVDFIIDAMYKHTIKVTGSVEFPNIIIKPTRVQIKKIVPQSMTQHNISIQNVSRTNVNVKFVMKQMPEFSIKCLDNNILKEINLEPEEIRQLFLEFHPTEAVAYAAYLPIKINNLFGPSTLNDPKTLNPKFFLKGEEFDELDSDNSMPKKLPVINVICAAGDSLLRFSRMNFEFCVNSGCIKHELTIENVTKGKISMVINLMEMAEPFNIKQIKSNTAVFFEKSCYVKIKSYETAHFQLTFSPNDYGNYSIVLPIFIKEYYDNCVFNYLKLSGTYEPPIIKPSTDVVYLGVTQPNVPCQENLLLHLINHNPSCELYFINNKKELTVTLTVDKCGTTAILEFLSQDVFVLCHHIIFNCTCQASCTITVIGISDNCISSSYTYLIRYLPSRSSYDFKKISIESDLSNFSSEGEICTYQSNFLSRFPFFPRPQDSSLYCVELRKALTAVESWLYTQGFFHRKYCRIPETITYFYSLQESPLILPLQKLILNLGNSSLLKYINEDSPWHQDSICDTMYCYTIYRNIIKFLNEEGMIAPHLRPELLLSYKQYELFKKEMIDLNDTFVTDIILSEEEFISLSTQCWLDIILQIHKIFVLFKVYPSLLIDAESSTVPIQKKFYRYYQEHESDIGNCNINEKVLLLWLEFNCLSCKHQRKKKVRNFLDDLRDGIVLCSALETYCPYMENDLSVIIESATTEVEITHNACVLVQAFHKLQLSIEIEPLSICNPNIIEMLLLVTYLYNVLPNYYPKEVIEINSTLSEESLYKIYLKNPNDIAICYTGIILSDSTTFQLDDISILIQPRKEKCAILRYNPNSVYKSIGTLILSGETPKYKYAKSIVFSLIGTPNFFTTNNIINLKVHVYEPSTHTLTIQSPYKSREKTSIYQCLKFPPSSLDNFISWQQWNKLEVPRQISSPQSSVHFNENGIAQLVVTICFIVPIQQEVLLFFFQESGHFCVKLNINVIMNKNVNESLYVDVPPIFRKTSCICEGVIRANCPKTLTINIPFKNQCLWNGLKNCIKSSREWDFQFWSKYLNLPVGIHILKLIMNSSFSWKHEQLHEIFSENVVYKAKLKTKPYSIQEQIVIPNPIYEDNLPVLIHWNSKRMPVKESLMLVAENGKEIRQYVIYFSETQNNLTSDR